MGHVLRGISLNRELSPTLRRVAFLARPSDEPGHVSDDPPDELPLLADFLTADEFSLLSRVELRKEAAFPFQDDGVSADECNRLAQLGDIGLNLALRQRECPTALLEAALDRAEPFLEWVARHPNVSPKRLAAALTTGAEAVRWAAARNPSLTAAQFDQLAVDPELRGFAAQNPSLPVEWMKRLAQERDATIRARLAGNPALPDDVQVTLADDPIPEIRRRLFLNPGLTRDAQRKLEAQGHRRLPDGLEQAIGGIRAGARLTDRTFSGRGRLFP